MVSTVAYLQNQRLLLKRISWYFKNLRGSSEKQFDSLGFGNNCQQADEESGAEESCERAGNNMMDTVHNYHRGYYYHAK